MSDASSSPRPHHSRSSSISKTTTRASSHQRKPSINSFPHLYSIQEQEQHCNNNNNINNINNINSSSNNNGNSNSDMDKKSSSRVSHATVDSSLSWRYYIQWMHLKIDTFFGTSSSLPSGPLLPQDKHTTIFSGRKQQSTGWLNTLGRSTLVRFLILLYVIFSILLSFQHLWAWFSAETLDARFGDDWVPQRTYDENQPYSMMDDMTHGLKMSKLFAKASYDSAASIKPFWLKAAQTPLTDDISIVTVITPATWSELERLADHWKGHISVTLHMAPNVDTMDQLTAQYRQHAELSKRVDIHLSESTKSGLSVLVPRNAERNLARLFAQTDYVMEMPSNCIPMTDIRRTLETNKDVFDKLLRDGDVLVVPTFGYPEQESNKFKLPSTKGRLLELVEEDAMHLVDKHWKPNTGPTDLDVWKTAASLYPVSRYDFHYEPIVIESKTVQPWCAERFLDSRSACLFATYLSGGELWVLPDDYMVELPEYEKSSLSDFDHVIENRLYAKFYWEQCVHHARQLDALGLWKGKRSQHIRTQCSRVITNWAKGMLR